MISMIWCPRSTSRCCSSFIPTRSQSTSFLHVSLIATGGNSSGANRRTISRIKPKPFLATGRLIFLRLFQRRLESSDISTSNHDVLTVVLQRDHRQLLVGVEPIGSRNRNEIV